MLKSRQVKKGSGIHGKTFNKRVPVYLLTCLLITLTACVSLPDPETSQDFKADIVAVVSPGHTVGQTFISRRPRLDGITLWLNPVSAGTPITVELSHFPQDPPIFTTTVGAGEGPTRIEIAAQPDPPGQNYYIELSSTHGEISVLGRDEDNYWDGTAHLDGQPLEADLAFRATYTYDWRAVLLDLREASGYWWLIIPLGMLLLYPGWLLLDFSRLDEHFDTGEKIAVSLGISIALTPVLMLWTSILGLKWGRMSVWVVAALMLGVLIGRWVRKVKHAGYKLNVGASNLQPSTGLILLAIFMVSAFVRFAMVRDLAAPAWVDSVHHAVITQKIVETGNFPKNYAPHIPLEASQYHPGYHSLLAAFIWLSDLELPQAMLIFGQVLNSLMIFPVYLLAKTLTKNHNAGLAAALMTGLFTLMPAYYASWGRYTQLAGLLILPAGFLWVNTIPAQKKHWLPGVLLGSLILAGLLIVHYRVLAFLGCLLLANWIAQIRIPMPGWIRTISAPLKYLVLLGLSSLLLSLAWLIPTLQDLIVPWVQRWGGGNATLSEINWRYLTPALGVPALVLAGLGLVLGIVKRKQVALTILLWVAALFVIANPGLFRLPFPAGFVNQSSVEIMLFMPISILGGYLAGEAISGAENIIPSRWVVAWKGAILFLGAGVALLGAQRLVSNLNPATFLFREADYAAMAWIRENIPQDEVIAINPTGWGYGLYMGNDGGYWIPALTGRQTMPPPALYGMSKALRLEVNGFVEALLPIGEDCEAFAHLLKEYEINYVYLGGRGGVISSQALAGCKRFEVIYQSKNTWIFQIAP